MGKIIDAKKELMSKIHIGDIVIYSKMDGTRFVVDYIDNRNFLLGIREIRMNEVSINGINYGNILWVHPEDIIIANNRYKAEKSYNLGTSIKKVIFSNPATIVFWSDGSKTVVKSYLDDYDPEKGLAMAIAKKALGNEGNYYNVFKKWLPKDDETIGELFCDQKAIETYKKNNDIINKALEDIKKNIKTSIPSSWDGNFIYRNMRGLLENDKY